MTQNEWKITFIVMIAGFFFATGFLSVELFGR